MATDRLNRSKFTWKGLALHYGKRKVLTLVADAAFITCSAFATRTAGRALRQTSHARRMLPMGMLLNCLCP